MMQPPPVAVAAVSTPTHGTTTTTQQHVNFVWHEGAIQFFLDASSSTTTSAGTAATWFQGLPAIRIEQPPSSPEDDLEEEMDDDLFAASEIDQGPTIPDYGGLEYHSLQQQQEDPSMLFERRIRKHDQELYDIENEQEDSSSFADPPAHETFEDHDLYQEKQGDPSREYCRRTNWAMQVYPNCNQIHELVLGRGLGIPPEPNNTNKTTMSST
jgi:hypothetical protein